MRLELIERHLKGCRVLDPADVEVTGISCDSRSIRGGGVLFAALPGEHVDGNDFIEDAVRRGAVCILTERETDIRGEGAVPMIIVPDVREALSGLASLLSGEPSKRLALVGVTGTNGKTTTTYLLEAIFSEAGFSAGVVGTVNYRYGAKVYPAPHTTPQAPELQGILKEMADSGVTHCAMEVSSHALEQKRVNGCGFDCVVFTNLTPEHLDYHKTMEEYFNAKALLFGLLKEGGRAVVNRDDPWADRALTKAPGAVTYSLSEGAEVHPLWYKLSEDGIRALVATPAGPVEVSSVLVGDYNLQNILASIAASIVLGIDARAVERGIFALERVPGRLEKVSGPGNLFNAYVDYAHTPDALERALATLAGITTGRIITVFGCGGNRDRTKRPRMGEAAARFSALTVITSDNPRDEDPLSIIGEIEAGIKGVRKYDADEFFSDEKGYMVIPERADAIRKAVTAARQGDTVLVAGKGHEDYQIIGPKRVHFDDTEVLRSALAAMS